MWRQYYTNSDADLSLTCTREFLTKISNDPTLIDKNRIELGKRNGGSDFVSTAINANPIWSSTGYDGNEILYGILSETVHANLTATLSHSQESGKFSYITKNPNIVALMNLLQLTIDYMTQLLIDLEL